MEKQTMINFLDDIIKEYKNYLNSNEIYYKSKVINEEQKLNEEREMNEKIIMFKEIKKDISSNMRKKWHNYIAEKLNMYRVN